MNQMCLGSLIVACYSIGLAPMFLLLAIGVPEAGFAAVGIPTMAALLAVVLAVVGLWRSFTVERGTVGRRYAVLAVFFSFALVFRPLTWNFAKGFRAGRAAAEAKAFPKAGLVITNEQETFQFAMPEAPWMQINQRAFSPFARLALRRGEPEVICLVMVKPLGGGVEGEGLDLAKAQLRTGAEEETLREVEPLTLRGMAGDLFEATGKYDGSPFNDVRWCAVTNDRLYQVTIRGIGLEMEDVRKQAAFLLSGFKLIEAAVEMGEVPD